MQIGTMQQHQETKYYNPIFHTQSSNKQLKLYCASGNLIQTVCVEYKCSKTSPHCLREDCGHCYGMHPFCKIIPLQIFQQFIRNNEEKQLQLWNMVHSAEQKMIKNIQDHQQRLLKDICYQGLPNKIRETFVSIFREKKFSHLAGMDFQSIKEQIKKFQPVDKTKQIRQLCEKISQDVDAYLKEKQDILTSFEGNQSILSKIIDKQEDIKFVFHSLGNPKKLELLYRGSQNQFSAAKFHQKCDEIPHTFTLVKTQFQRVIAGYTPLKWSSPSSWAYFSDTLKKSFLLQVNRKEKFALAEDLYAIYCHQSHGPRFGRADLMIPNKCHQNNCTGSFPTSYHLLGKYQNNQQSYTTFSGSPNGFAFRALEYEVFKVIF